MTLKHNVPRLLALATLALSSVAMAQYGPGRPDGHGNDHHDNRGNDHHDNGPDRGGPRGPGPGMHGGDYHPRFARGQRLPNDYRSRQYVIEDYRPYRLQRPPRGYQWISVGPDFFLAAVATGVIAQVVLGGR